MTKRTCPTCFGPKPNFHAAECRKCGNKTRTRPIDERFFEFVKKTETCWLWTGARDMAGYGRFSFKTTFGYSSKPAHRMSWEIRNGKIPPKMSVCHTCDTPPCVNPDHLFVGSQYDNALDCTLKGRNERVRKLTYPMVQEIKRIRSEGLKLGNIRTKYGFGSTFIAKKLGISKSIVDKILSGETWKHVK